jgi:tRNA(Ile)-lysidine synthase TilS/MesJ
MDKTILHHLFDGEINPSEIIGTSNAELREIYAKLEIEKPALLENLPQSTLAEIERIDELTEKAHGIYSRECFVYGFKLGAMLLLEALTGKNDLVHKKPN